MGVRLRSRNTPVGKPCASLTIVTLRGARVCAVTPMVRSAAEFATDGKGGVLHHPQTLRMKTGLFGRHDVEVMTRGKATLRELRGVVDVSERRIAERRQNDPFAGRGLFDGTFHDRDNLVDRPQPRDRNAGAGFQTLPVHMGVPVEEARHGRTPAEIDGLDPRRSLARDLLVGADRHYPSVRDCERRGDARAAVKRDDVAIAKDELRILHDMLLRGAIRQGHGIGGSTLAATRAWSQTLSRKSTLRALGPACRGAYTSRASVGTRLE